MRVVAVVSARGAGSSWPNKNMQPLLGKPMVQIFLEEMRKCAFLDALCVWTESEEIARIADSLGCVPLHRPKSMVHYGSSFHTPFAWDQYAGDRIYEALGYFGEIQVSLNCNYVLFTAESLERMYHLLMDDGVSNDIFPYYPVEPHLYMIHPAMPQAFPIWECPGVDRQNFPPLYRRIGIAITHVQRPQAKGQRRSLHHIVKPWEGWDVQSPDDVPFAEFMLEKRCAERNATPPVHAPNSNNR